MDRTIRLDWIQAPFCEPFRISNGSVAAKDAILVSYQSDGVTGWGEASPMAGSFYSAETPESTWAALNQLAPAKAGITGALLDRDLRARGIPLWKWLGSSKRPVASGAAIGIFDTIDDLLERVARFVQQGYRRVKVKIQPGWDVEPVSRIPVIS